MKYDTLIQLIEEARKALAWYDAENPASKKPSMPQSVAKWIVRHVEDAKPVVGNAGKVPNCS